LLIWVISARPLLTSNRPHGEELSVRDRLKE